MDCIESGEGRTRQKEIWRQSDATNRIVPEITNIGAALTVHHHHSLRVIERCLPGPSFNSPFEPVPAMRSQRPVYGSIAYTECVLQQLTIRAPLGVAAIPLGASSSIDSLMVLRIAVKREGGE